MARRRYTRRMRCAHEGCREYAHFEFDTRRDLVDHERRTTTWKCVRHATPDTVLAVDNLRRERVLVAGPSEQFPDLTELFWSDGFGFVHGPGFKAYANDFPPGTRLRVTAEILLPEGVVDEDGAPSHGGGR